MKHTNIILTSMFAICVAMPAMATSYDAGDTGTCNNDALGAYSGTVSATANFSINSYTCPAGTYLPADGIECTQCPANSYCGGDTYQYNQSSAQGATACPSGYTSSAAGASAQSQCYRACTTADVAHSTSVTGMFYQDQTNACEPANSNACANGYHYVAGFSSSDLPASSTSPSFESYKAKTNNGSYYCNGDDGDCFESGDMTEQQLAQYSDLNNGEWKISWTSGAKQGTMKGIASCNSTAGDHASWQWNNDPSNWSRPSSTFNSSSTGQYCWCKPTSWTASGGGGEQSLSAAWVFLNDRGDADLCAAGCAVDCADGVDAYSEFRAAVLGVVGATPAQCNANEITINWGGYGANNDQNETNTCTYGETLTAPSTAPSKKGHTFAGWTFGN